MKLFFDTNLYIAEARLGIAAEEMLSATERGGWRIFISDYVLDEIERVLTERLRFSTRLAKLTRERCLQRATFVPERASRHEVPSDLADSPILRAALDAGADYLVTNDKVLLTLNRYESLRIISLADYYILLTNEGLLP